MSDFFVVAVWLILRKCCHFKRMHWSSALILYFQPAMSAIGYLPRRAFWHIFVWICPFKHNTSRRELNTCTRSEARIYALLMSYSLCVLKCLNWQSLHEFSLIRYQRVLFRSHLCAPGWWRNKCSYSSIRHSHWTRVNGLSTSFSLIAVVVMYWEARMRVHQQKHTLAEPCFFMLFITNNIAY